MGVLWIAEHRALGSEVVVKFLCDELAGDSSAARRIAHEAAAAARVRSPHVVQILDHGVSEGTPFIVMELLEGRDLRAHLEAYGALPQKDTMSILYQLAKALEKTHSAGIVHRDVKPSNIFLCDADGDVFVKLLDFGLAQRSASVDPSTSPSRHGAGTPPYMSPEQILGDAVDARTDVWSLGAVAFQCLTGRRPFEGETLGAIALSIHTLALPRPTEVNRDLPLELDAWFARACARSKNERFFSAMKAAEALSDALGLALPAPPQRSPPDRPPGSDRTITGDFAITKEKRLHRGRRRRTSQAWFALGILVVAVGAAAAAYRATISPYPRPIAGHSLLAPALPTEAFRAPRVEATIETATGEPGLSAHGPTSEPSPRRVVHSVDPTDPRLKTALAPSPTASAPARTVAPADANHRTVRAFELPDERY